jgi:transcriptional regulator with XRE-family HTH domain
MPGIRPRREPHEGTLYPSQLVGQRCKQARRLHDGLSQEEVAERMVTLGHETWTRQTVGQVEAATRNLTVDELVSLAAALQASLAYLLSPSSPTDPYSDELVDIGGPAPLDRNGLLNLYGFNTSPLPQAHAYYDWPDTDFRVSRNWDEVMWENGKTRWEGGRNE